MLLLSSLGNEVQGGKWERERKEKRKNEACEEKKLTRSCVWSWGASSEGRKGQHQETGVGEQP